MLSSLKRIWAVALLTSTEGLRQPVFFLVFFTAAGLTAASPAFAFFHLGEEAKMVTDLGLSTVLTFSTLLAILTASSTITDEIEGRTALTMLSKPLKRTEFLLGKYFGIGITTSALVVLMGPAIVITLRSQKFIQEQDPQFTFAVLVGLLIGLICYAVLLVLRLLFRRGISMILGFWIAYGAGTAFILIYLSKRTVTGVWDFRPLMGLLFIGLHAWLISAVAVLLATRFTLIQAAIGTVVFFIVGHASGAIIAPFRSDAHELSIPGLILRTILPDLDQYNITDAIATAFLDLPVEVPWQVIAGSSAYTACYVVALLALAAAMFSRRELG
jgi:ABC-type transport system involved in multi-copper enzyme maturation permease subunit